jgi:AhpD family alkylhydroperoxidase
MVLQRPANWRMLVRVTGAPMSTVKVLTDAELSPEAAAVFADIRATRKTEFVNNFWRTIAHDPMLLKRTWESVRQVMAPGALDPLTKELLYVAVSIANNCEYCIRSHTAAARAKGMTDQQLMELVAVVGMASETNRLATGLQVHVDDVFMGHG